jgi:hypothetical protein
MRHMSERGEYLGGAPRLGYRLADGHLETQEAEQAAIREARSGPIPQAVGRHELSTVAARGHGQSAPRGALTRWKSQV